MKALILAAGFGKRLRPITNSIPKSMVEVGGKPLLINAIDNLIDNGILEIGIVLGHMADYIRSYIGTEYRSARIYYFENERYLETNNVVSLYKALPFCDDDMLLLECDLFYQKELISQLVSGKGDCTILVSPFNPKTMDGTVIITEGDKAKSLVLGKWQDSDLNYQCARKTVNLYRFTSKFLKAYAPMIKWYVENISEDSYYEKVLGGLIYLREYDVRVTEVPENAWCEIDDAEDLERARKRFGN